MGATFDYTVIFMSDQFSTPLTSDPLSIAVRQRDKDVLKMVDEALSQNRGLLAYQPIVQAQRSDRSAYFEGLIRICDPTGRVIPAKDFIAEVEDTEVGRRIDCLALQLGLEALAEHPHLRLAINMSAKSIGYKPWNRVLHRALRKDSTIGERLILEITERTAIVMPELVQSFMSEQQSRGISFALDDFGAGYTAFRYLRDFYFDILKIDGEFIRGIHASPDDQVLVRALVAVAQHFDMLTVAEFVETEADARLLTDIGVDCLQGYYFGRPSTEPVFRLDSRKTA